MCVCVVCCVGIYNEASVGLEVEETEPDLSVMRESIDCMRQAGVKVCVCVCVCE